MEKNKGEPSKVDSIRKLFLIIPKYKRAEFINLMCEMFDKRFGTVRFHWFSESGGWSVPIDYQDKVINYLELFTKTTKT